MSDVRAMFDRAYLGAWDLQGRDVTVTIKGVVRGDLRSPGSKKTTRKPVVEFERTEKRLACNKTNANTIAGLYGFDTKAWIGKQITLYPTTTTFGRETVDCVRIRPTVPKQKRSEGIESKPVDPEMRERQNRASEAAMSELEEGAT